MCALTKAEMKVVLFHLQGVGHPEVRQRPTAVSLDLQIFGTILQPDANVAFRLVQYLARVVLAAVRHRRIFLPLDAVKASNPGNHSAGEIGHLPSRIERTYPARREPCNGVTVRIFADVVLRSNLGQYLVAQKS